MGKVLKQIYAILFRVLKGKMDKDVDIRYLKDGDFIDSLNTRNTTTLGGTTGDRENILGNNYAYTVPTVELQNKTFRVYIDVTANLAYSFQFTYYDGNGNVLVVGTPVVLSTPNDLGTSFTEIFAGIEADMGSANINNGNGATLITTSLTTGYFDFAITTIPGWDYSITENLTFAGNPVDLPTFVFSAESIDASLAGIPIEIGSYDLEGELIQWLTTQTHLPSTDPVLSISNSGGKILIGVADTTIYTDDALVVISGLTNSIGPPNEASGNWIITIVDATHFLLQGSTFGGGYTGNGVATINSQGYGEVGHAVRDENTLLWTYVRLIGSKVFNFRTKKQIDPYCEKDAVKKAYYWTDDYNVMRVLYDHTLVYQNDCLLNFIDPLNTYDYATLEVESRLILSTTDLELIFTGQTQSGGAIPSGNNKYTIRLVNDQANTFTDWLPLSNPIPAASASEAGNPSLFFGDAAGILTPKINNFQVRGNILGIFKYVELAVVNYLDGGFNGYIIKRQVISSNDFAIQHTGLETGTQDLDVGTLSAFTQVYTKAKNMDALAGSLLISNLETTAEIDYGNYFNSLHYSIERRAVSPSVGSKLNTNTFFVGEYELSDNVYSQAGYMLQERYRFGAVVEWISGGLSKAFFIDDIIFNRTANARKTINIPDYDLINNTPNPIAYSYYVNFLINENTIVGGKKIKDVVRRIHIVRCPVDSAQVLASGIAIIAGKGYLQYPGAGPENTAFGWTYSPGFIPNDAYGEFPFPAGLNEGTLAPTPTNPLYANYAGSSDYTKERQFASIYFPDMYMGNTQITPIPDTDKILNYGQGDHIFGRYADAGYGDYLYEDENLTPLAVTAFDTLNVKEMHFISRGGDVTFTSGERYCKNLQYLIDGASSVAAFFSAAAVGGWVVKTDTAGGFKNLTGVSDYAFYRIQYTRPITLADDQYGLKIQSKYMFTGAVFTTNNSETSVDVFGGDTLTQKCWYKDRYPDGGAPLGFGQGFGFYTQNRINFQMRQKGSIPFAYPATANIQLWLNDVDNEILLYNKGYNASVNSINAIQLMAAFDPDPEATNSDFPCREAWSANKIPGSAQDSYRVFLPLNFKDLDYKNGEINAQGIANGELITWQVLCLMRQFFDSTGMLKTVGGDEVILGSGAKMSRRGVVVTSYGTKNKYSVCHGKSAGGDDVFYYIDTTNKALFRVHLFGDGTVNLGMVHGLDSFLEENLRFVDGIDTPADGTGICAVWNERNKEAIFTIRGHKQGVEVWNAIPGYSAGQVVRLETVGFSTFEQTGEFFISTGNGTNQNQLPAVYNLPYTISTITGTTVLTITTVVPHKLLTGDQVLITLVGRITVPAAEATYFTVTVTGANTFTITVTSISGTFVSAKVIKVIPFYWTLVEHNNPEFYNEYTLVFNELINGFSGFCSFKPKIYLPFKNTYLSPSPVLSPKSGADQSWIFEHNRGRYCEWYIDQIEDGFYEFVINANPQDIKSYYATRFRTLIGPERVDLISSDNQQTFMVAADYQLREQNYDASVKNDILTSSTGTLNDTDTGKLVGDSCRVKLTFKAQTYQVMNQLLMRVRSRARNNQS